MYLLNLTGTLCHSSVQFPCLSCILLFYLLSVEFLNLQLYCRLSPFNSVSFCFVYFDGLLLSSLIFVVVVYSFYVNQEYVVF